MVTDQQIRRLRKLAQTENTQAIAAAIDRLVHHSVILELNLPSYRMSQAKGKQDDEKKGD